MRLFPLYITLLAIGHSMAAPFAGIPARDIAIQDLDISELTTNSLDLRSPNDAYIAMNELEARATCQRECTGLESHK